MTLNDCRDEAGAFLAAIGAGETRLKTLDWLGEEVVALKTAVAEGDMAGLRHQIYDVLFLLFELAAKYDLDLNGEWAAGRQRKQAKYLEGR